MFELPENTESQVREDVVSRIVETMYRKHELYYCDEHVSMDGEPEFRGYHSGPRSANDNRKFVTFSIDERKRAFEIFREKGYHIAKQSWYSPKGNYLWYYNLRERKDREEDNNFHWVF